MREIVTEISAGTLCKTLELVQCEEFLPAGFAFLDYCRHLRDTIGEGLRCGADLRATSVDMGAWQGIDSATGVICADAAP